jgi:putative ABC transport system permease protein
VVGALRSDLFNQNIIEALLVSLISLPLAIILVQFLLPEVSPLLGVKITSAYFHNWVYILMFFIITMVIGLIAGGYISIYLSRLSPVNVFKNKLNIGSNKAFFRKILMISQMVIFVGLIFSSVIIYKQMQYFINKDFGFNKEQLLIFYPDDFRFGDRLPALKSELLNNSDIINISAATMAPGTGNKQVIKLERKDSPDQKITLEEIGVDKDFIETMEMKMLAGESLKNSFSVQNENPEKKITDCIINETGVKELGLKNPIGEIIENRRIIGVVKDFNLHSLHEKIGPLIIRLGSKYLDEIILRLKPGNIPNTVKVIQDKSKEFNSGKPMDFDFFDERLKALYFSEQSFQKVIGYATGIAVFIACLGIFGISFFICQQRVKEIGIRKVLGASVKNIYLILTKEYLMQILVASLLAFPLSYYLISKWLQNFEYRIEIDLWTFVLSDILALLIVYITVSIRVIKAVRANPVESIRYE